LGAKLAAKRGDGLRVAVVGRADSHRRAVSALEDDGVTPVARVTAPGDLPSSGADVVVLVTPPAPQLVDAVDQIRSILPETRVVVVASEPPTALRDVFADGVYGLVLEDELERCLPLAVRSAAVGQVTLPSELRGVLGRPSLTAREKQVLGMVVLGLTNREMALQLHLSESTVKSHLSTAFRKLGVRSRSEAVTRVLDPSSGLGTGILAISADGLARAGTRVGSLLNHN
jgi:DNA-binding NarL/FixJ family response regulator